MIQIPASETAASYWVPGENNKPVLIHNYARSGRDIEIYRNPLLVNWTFLN